MSLLCTVCVQLYAGLRHDPPWPASSPHVWYAEIVVCVIGVHLPKLMTEFLLRGPHAVMQLYVCGDVGREGALRDEHRIARSLADLRVTCSWNCRDCDARWIPNDTQAVLSCSKPLPDPMLDCSVA
jgi:hypothetical protein